MSKTPPAAGTAANLEDEFNIALTALVEQVRRDTSILAAILCGSLSHDTVWSKSDIDLLLVTIDDKKAPKESLCLYADGINVHAILMPRADFRKTAEGALRNSFMHSLLAKGRLLYSHDESIAGLCERLHALGERDTQFQLLAAAAHALPCIYKAHKWLITRGDLNYTALWILYSANALAKIEVLEAGLLVDREVLPQALELNPSFFKLIYTDLLNAKKTMRAVEGRAGGHRSIFAATRRQNIRPHRRAPDRSGRSSLGHRNRLPLPAQLWHRGSFRGVRIPRRPGSYRQSAAPCPADQTE
jgi:uncharacterized protein